jgi:hypothetical protein
VSDYTPAGAESVRVRCDRCGVLYHPEWEDCKCNPDAHWGKCFECGREIDATVSDSNGWEINGHPLCESCWVLIQEDFGDDD